MAEQTTAVQKRIEHPLMQAIEKAKGNFIQRLPNGIDPGRFVLSLMTAIQKSKANSKPGHSLMECDPNSVLLAAYDAAELGCSLSPALALGWLIPYEKEAQFQPSYRFFIQKAYETKEVKTFFAEVVYGVDRFERQFAPKRNLFHAPGDGTRDKSNAIGAYALIEFSDGTIDWEYLTAEQIGRHRNHSKQPNSMKWVQFWEEGWRITPIRVLAKRIPLKNRDLEGVVEMINRDTDRELSIPIEEIIEPSVPRRTSQPATTTQPQAATPAVDVEVPLETKDEPTPAATPAENQEPAASAEPGGMFTGGDADPYLLPAEIQEFWKKTFEAGCSKQKAVEFLKKNYKVDSPKELRRSQLANAIKEIVKTASE